MSSQKQWTFFSFLKLGLFISAIGYVPLQLYIVFGPADGNPIGLGLLFVVCMFAGFCVVAVGAIRVLWQMFRG